MEHLFFLSCRQSACFLVWLSFAYFLLSYEHTLLSSVVATPGSGALERWLSGCVAWVPTPLDGMSREGKGEKKIHITSPENGSSSGQVRTVTPLHICRTYCWWTLSKCWWWKLRMVWEILYHVMRCWSPVFIRNAFREWPTMWNIEVTAVKTALCWLSVVKPSHWMAVINVLILWQGK